MAEGSDCDSRYVLAGRLTVLLCVCVCILVFVQKQDSPGLLSPHTWFNHTLVPDVLIVPSS